MSIVSPGMITLFKIKIKKKKENKNKDKKKNIEYNTFFFLSFE